VSREHRRAKSDRLDLGLLKRAFLGWLRGEAKHCSMAAIPSLAEEDARRAHRERQTLGHEASRIVNRIKSSLARLGIGGFNPQRRDAAVRLGGLRTGEGEAVPPLSLAELARELARLALVRAQIRQIEVDRGQRLNEAPDTPAHRMTALLARLHGLGLETAELLASEAFGRRLRDQRAVARYAGLTGAPDESGRKAAQPHSSASKAAKSEPAARLFEMPVGDRRRALHGARAVVPVNMSALRFNATIRPPMPWLRMIAANSERRVANSLIEPSR
jgi:transposase